MWYQDVSKWWSMKSNIWSMMIKGERYIVFLMKVHAQSGLSKVEEKQQCQIIVKKDLQDPENWQWKDCCTKSRLPDREEEKSIADR